MATTDTNNLLTTAVGNWPLVNTDQGPRVPVAELPKDIRKFTGGKKQLTPEKAMKVAERVATSQGIRAEQSERKAAAKEIERKARRRGTSISEPGAIISPNLGPSAWESEKAIGFDVEAHPFSDRTNAYTFRIFAPKSQIEADNTVPGWIIDRAIADQAADTGHRIDVYANGEFIGRA